MALSDRSKSSIPMIMLIEKQPSGLREPLVIHGDLVNHFGTVQKKWFQPQMKHGWNTDKYKMIPNESPICASSVFHLWPPPLSLVFDCLARHGNGETMTAGRVLV